MLKTTFKNLLGSLSARRRPQTDLCIVTQNLEWGGSEAVWERVAVDLAEQGQRLAVFVPHQLAVKVSKRAKLKHANIQIIGYEMGGLKNNLKVIWQLLRYKPRFAYISQRHSMDCLGWMNLFTLLNISYVNFIPLCFASVWCDDNLLRWMLPYFAKSKLLMFDSSKNADFFDQMLGQRYTNKKKVYFPADDVNDFSKSFSPHVRFGIMARFDCHHKGYDILLQALADLPSHNWSLLIVGYGPHRSLIERLVALHELQDRVQLSDYMPKAEFFKNIDVSLFPSRLEGVPLVLLDAIAYRTVCVVTDVGGMCELIKEGKTGFVAPYPTPEAFTQAIQRCLDHRGQWATMTEKVHSEWLEQSRGQLITDVVKRVMAP